MPMKTILVGFDESAESLRAAEQATDLCKRTGARLLFATAVPLPTAEGPLLPEFSESDGRLRQSARAKLERARRHALEAGVDAAVVSTEGLAPDVLAQLAEQANVDLVVIGHRHRSALLRAVLGSTADRLLQISPRPVMVVR
jgi:nucleotide-binding universal stress UspA family protein